MIRTRWLYTQLLVHRPVDDREAASIVRMRAELARLAQPFDAAADAVHVTASAIVTGPRGVLLHRHRKLGIWLQPGGHIDRDELPWDAAVRETREETGIAVRHPDSGPRLVHVDVHPGPGGHTHLDVRFVVLAGDDEPCPPPGESQEVRWFTWDEALAVADPGLVGALRALRPS
jgi:8-oxo-dGTP pyrophosphatase MutT (NUDIX family)